MPTQQDILEKFEKQDRSIWLGNTEAYRIYDSALLSGKLTVDDCDRIQENMHNTPHLFATGKDSNCYEWLKALGCYSPIIHLQQTDGRSSPHKSFTKENNSAGFICADQVLKALKESYDQKDHACMPNRCAEIYLTLEVFSGTAQTAREILEQYEETVCYWRRFIPRDGLTLDRLVQVNNPAQSEQFP